MIKLYHGDCLEEMKKIADNSVDLVLCDPPYGTTDCQWDSIIPPDKMWEQYIRNNQSCCFDADRPRPRVLPGALTSGVGSSAGYFYLKKIFWVSKFPKRVEFWGCKNG